MLPLTKENVALVFETGVLSDGSYSSGLGSYLHIPYDLTINPLAAADWWLTHGSNRSWRTIIFFLDKIDVESELSFGTEIAEELMPYSEPLSGVQGVFVTSGNCWLSVEIVAII